MDQLGQTGSEPKIASSISRELAQTEKEIAKTEKAMSELVAEYEKMQSFKGVGSAATQQDTTNKISGLDIKLMETGETLDKLHNKSSKLQNKLQEIKLNPQASDEGKKLQEDFTLATEKLKRLEDEAVSTKQQLDQLKVKPEVKNTPERGRKAMKGLKNAVKSVNDKLLQTNKLTKKTDNGFTKLLNRIGRMVLAVGVFNVIRKALRSLVHYLGSALMTNNQFVTSLGQIKSNLLTAFQPIFEAVMPALNVLMAALSKITGYIAAFFNLIFGKSLKASQDSAKSLYNQAKGYGAVGKAAKKAGGELAAFDELNVLSKKDEDDGGAGGASAPQFDTDFSFLEDALGKFENAADKFYELGKIIAENINNSLSNIDWDSIQARAKEIAINIASFLNGFIANLDWNLLGETIAQGLNTAVIFAYHFIETFDWKKFGVGVGTALNGAVKKFNWKLLGETIGKGISGAVTFAYNFMKTVDWDSIGSSIATSLNNVIENINWRELGALFASKWSALVDTIHGFVTNFNWPALGRELSEVVNGWFNEIDWAKAGNTLSTSIKGLLTTIRTFIQGVEWAQIGKDITTFLVNIDWGGMVLELALAIGTALGGLAQLLFSVIEEAVDSIVDFFKQKFEENGGNIILGLFDGILTALSNLSNWIRDHIFIPFINGFKSVFGIHSPSKAMAEMGGFLIDGLKNGLSDNIKKVIEVFKNLWDTIKKTANDAWEGVKNVWNVMRDWFDTTIVQPVTEIFSTMWDNIKEAAGSAWDKVKEIWEIVSTWFTDTIIDPVSDAFSSLGNKILAAMASAANGVVNVFEKAINWVIRQLNKINFDIPDWVPKIGGKSFGISISEVSLPHIPVPKLATGAVIPPNSEFMAILGDQKKGTNIETPEGLLREIFQEELSNLGRGETELTLNFTGDLAALARVLNPYLEQDGKRKGVKLVTGGALV